MPVRVTLDPKHNDLSRIGKFVCPQKINFLPIFIEPVDLLIGLNVFPLQFWFSILNNLTNNMTARAWIFVISVNHNYF